MRTLTMCLFVVAASSLSLACSDSQTNAKLNDAQPAAEATPAPAEKIPLHFECKNTISVFPVTSSNMKVTAQLQDKVLKLGVTALPAVCGARTMDASATWKADAKTLSIEVEQTGHAFCWCEYDLATFDVSIPSAVGIDAKAYTLEMKSKELPSNGKGFSSKLADLIAP